METTALTTTAKQPTQTLCLAEYSPDRITATCKGIATVEQAITAKLPCLKRLANANDEEAVKDTLRAHLLSLDYFLKQKSSLSPEEIELITDEVFTAYGHILSFADINVIFKNAKLGRYGELYQQLSCPKIMSWFDEYVNQRLDTAEEMTRRADMQKYGYSDGSDRRRERTSEPQQLGGYMVWKAQYLEDGTI